MSAGGAPGTVLDAMLRWAALTPNAVAVPLPWPAAAREHVVILASSRVRAVLVSGVVVAAGGLDDHRLPVLTLRRGVPGQVWELRVADPVVGASTPNGLPGPDDVGVILHSSGTTGTPKRVPRTHRAMAAACAAMVAARAKNAVRRSPLKSTHSTAGALGGEEPTGLEALFGVPILNGYGLSEAPAVAGERFPRERIVPGTVGKPWCEVEIVGGERRRVAAGTHGEIVVRGPTIFPGYLDDPAASAAAFLPGGWFRTGDVGFLDETINRGGEKIVPDEVDRALNDHPAVAEAAVFAVPDDHLGEDIAAAVVLAPGARCSAREVRRWLAPRLSLYKIPRRIWFVERLPRTRTGKVQRAELTRLWSEARW